MTDPRFNQRRRRGVWQRARIYVVGAGLLTLAGVLVWLIWFSTVLGVRNVSIEGLQTLKSESVKATAAITQGEPLARVDIVSIKARVAKLDRVAAVEVSRSWPSTIQIEIVERTAVAWLTSDGDIRGVDRFGVDFRTYSKAPKALFEIRVTARGNELRQEAVVEAARVVAIIKAEDQALFAEVKRVNVGSQDSVELVLTKGRTVTWGSADNSTQKLAVLRPLLGIKASIYDVSAPEQPTTKK